jgi:curved DNA-binding protein CbpA
MKNKNLYKTLGVSPDSEDVVIIAAYKALMRKYHPDKSSDSQATSKAAEINEAYAILGDPEKRAAYDRENGYSHSDKHQEPAGDAPESSKSSDNTKVPERELEPTRANSKWGLWQYGSIAAGIILIAVIYGESRNRATDYSTEATSDYTDIAADAVTYDASEGTLSAATATAGPDIDLLGTSEFALPETAKKTLGPLSSLSYPDIEKAVFEFDRVLAQRGILGAKSYSIKCHEAAKESMEWSKYDFCVAFDLAAAHLDNAVTEKNETPPNAYFSFMSENAADQYVGAQFMSDSLKQRVNSIQRAVRPALLETLSARIAKDADSGPNGDPTNDVTSTK